MYRILVTVLLFGCAASTYGQEKSGLIGKDTTMRKKSVLPKGLVTEIDTTLHKGKNKVKEVKNQLVVQKDKSKADIKEIYQTVFIARDTSLLKEQTIKISSELAIEKNKIKSSMQSLQPAKIKGSLQQQSKAEVQQIKDEVGIQKDGINSSLRAINPKNLDSVATKAGNQHLSKEKDQLKGEKDKMKEELKKPIDFDLNIGNNGTQTKSQSKDNWEQKLREIKDFKLEPGKGGQQPTILPEGNLPLKSVDKLKLKLEEKNIPSISDLEKPSVDGKPLESKGVKKLITTTNRVSDTDARGALDAVTNLTNAKTILSERQLTQLRDSLGLKKFDSIYNKATLLATKKEVSKEDLLQTLNQSMAEKIKQPAIDESKVGDISKQEGIDQIKGMDLRNAELPAEVLQQLPPLSGNLVDAKYMKLVDSLRNRKLNDQQLKLKERELSKNATEVVFKKRPTFLDKAYFDGVIGVVGNENATILQIAPCLGYHLLPLFSLGIGPMLSLQKQGGDFNSTIGIRSFAKVELFKQRGYLQVEHQISPYKVDSKNFTSANGSFFVGGGVVKKLFDKIAVNLSLLYRINEVEIAGASPWVFRIGISTVDSDKSN
jgi:hypothetical protein